MAGAPRWSIALTALFGAWFGHFFEYVRVAGWHVAIAEMSSSVHSYFFPAGAGLMAMVVGAAWLARRLWSRLGKRLRAAEIGMWRRPTVLPATADTGPAGPIGVLGLWLLLSVLQSGTWMIQENLPGRVIV